MERMEAAALRILIADDNAMVRRGVITLLSSETSWEICGEAGDGSEALLKARTLRPDVILLDVSMPGVNGLEVARRLRRELSYARIVESNEPRSLANAPPVLPKPTIPTVFPISSVPRLASLTHFPSLISASLDASLFISVRSIPNTCSATALRFPSGLLTHRIPRDSA